MIYQLEEGVAGTRHFQGYCWFKLPMTLAGCKKLLPGAHWERCVGTHEQNVAYCSKEPRLAGPFIRGEPPAQGLRSDLLAVKAAVDSGATDLKLWTDYFGTMARYSRAIHEYRRVMSSPRDFLTTCSVFWGPTGTGKSRKARELYPQAYWKPRNSWFDGYSDQETVILDDFYGWLPWDLLLRMIDRYPLLVDIKGGMVNFRPKHIVITSNKHPRDWYHSIDDWAPLERRITTIIHYIESL